MSGAQVSMALFLKLWDEENTRLSDKRDVSWASTNFVVQLHENEAKNRRKLELVEPPS